MWIVISGGGKKYAVLEAACKILGISDDNVRLNLQFLHSLGAVHMCENAERKFTDKSVEETITICKRIMALPMSQAEVLPKSCLKKSANKSGKSVRFE